MNYHFSKYLLLRTPLYPTKTYEQPLHIAVKDPVFRAAIYLASPQFFARLAKAGFDPAQMEQRELTALKRYFNRACYRATPFGYFASAGMGEWLLSDQAGEPDIAPGLQVYLQPAEYLLQTAARQGIANDLPETRYEPNPTLYRVKKYYRFIKEETGINNKRTFQLQSSLYSLVLKGLLKYCRNGQYKEAIIARICTDAHCSAAEGTEYFEFLIDAQILLPKNRPAILGVPAFPGCDQGQSLRAGFPVRSPLLMVESLRELEGQFVKNLKGGSYPADKSLLNTILVRSPVQPLLDSRYQGDLKDGFYALDCLCPPDQLPALTRFKEAFLRHFDGERIPLLMAIDPEFGIGYQAEAQESPNPLMETVNIRPRSTAAEGPAWTAAHRYLMAAWLKAGVRHNGVITLDEAGLNSLKSASRPLSSLGFSALFSISDQGTFIESAGGVNPAALIGRFTLADPAIYKAAKNMANEIELLNPDVLFAELLHLADPHVDNVNRRAQLWANQLPLLAGQANGEIAGQLRLDDLSIEVNDNLLLLWSKKHQKYVIPRLTSAYNHSIDPLPLFRFLADLSYQYSRSQLYFDLAGYFPGFSYYPRVCYKRTILSLATWIIETKELPASRSGEEWMIGFNKMAERLGLPEQFSLTEGDQQLIFNRLRPEDLELLSETIQMKKQVILREYLAPADNDPSVQDRYQNQYNAFLLPDEPLKLPAPLVRTIKESQEQRKFIPGTEWLYLKLYVPRLSVNRLLLEIEPILRKRFPHGKISRWFFIRYEDHAPHIRLRLKVSPEDIDMVLAALRVILEDNVHQHLIREYQLDVYSRELERYQAIGMEESEAFFWYSSSFVLQYLKSAKSGSTIPAYLAAALTTKLITAGFYDNANEQLTFWQQAFEAYLTEFEGRQLKIDLDKKYRETSPALEQFLHLDIPFADKGVQQWANKLSVKSADLGSKLGDEATKRDYLLSLIHVHLNRLFTDQPRQQEMLIYFLLAKWMRSHIARQKLRPIGPS